MKAVNLTLLYDGTTEAAFTFYKSVFGGEFSNVQRMKDIPAEHPVQDEEKEKILHMSFPITDNFILMGMDLPAGRGSVNAGNNFFVTLDVESEAEADKFFNGLSEGGNIMMPLADQFWGSYFGMFTDKFGIQWMVSYAR